MKRLTPWLLLLATAWVILAPWAMAATTAPRMAAPAAGQTPGAAMATALATVTGIAISPLIGTGAYGAYQWLTAKDETERALLPWFAQMKFWLPALLLVAVCAGKDALGTMLPPGAKKPLDVLEAVENKVSGLVAAGAVVPFTMDFLSQFVLGGKTTGVELAAMPDGLAMIAVAGENTHWLLDALTVPFGIAVFALVWMASHAITVLILLSPWGAIDAALKAARTALLGLLTLSATIDPRLGAALSLVVIVVAYFTAGWAFRLTVFGSVFCWDFFTVRRARFVPRENDNPMFAGGDLPGVPSRTYGRLVQRTAGGLEFVYRPWLWLPARVAKVPVATTLAVGRGLFLSNVVTDGADVVFLLPPRYRGHEDTLARAYLMGGGVCEAGLRKAWSSLKELFGGAAPKTQSA